MKQFGTPQIGGEAEQFHAPGLAARHMLPDGAAAQRFDDSEDERGLLLEPRVGHGDGADFGLLPARVEEAEPGTLDAVLGHLRLCGFHEGLALVLVVGAFGLGEQRTDASSRSWPNSAQAPRFSSQAAFASSRSRFRSEVRGMDG